jgi:hypothetical protein
MENLDVNQCLNCLSAGLRSANTTDDVLPLSPKDMRVKTSASDDQNGLINEDWKK